MSTGYEVGALYKGKTAPVTAGQGDVFVDQTTGEVSVHNGLRFAGPAFSSVAISGALTVAGGTATGAVNISSGNLLFGATGQRVTGDMSNATSANRLLLQTSTTNGTTNVGAIPNGVGTTAQSLWYNTSDPDNAGRMRVGVSGTGAFVNAQSAGAGSVPTSLAFSGFATYTFDANIGFNGSAAIAKPTVTGSRGANAALASLLTALASYGLVTDSSS